MSVTVSVRDVREGVEDSYTFENGVKIMDLLEELDRNPETIVVKRNGMIVPEQEELEDEDEIEIIPVVSGG